MRIVGTDRPQNRILLVMLLVSALLVGAALLRRARRSSPESERVEVPPALAGMAARARVSLMPAPARGEAEVEPSLLFIRPLDLARIGRAARFDSPLGSERGALAYNAQPFGESQHLGDDLNGIGGWDSDLGDPVYAIGAGRVIFAGWPGEGWGRMVIVAHGRSGNRFLESVYAHLDSSAVAVDDRVSRGQVIGAVGKGAGQYLAHLHFEMRDSLAINPGKGYARGPLDRIDPEGFLESHRGASGDFLSAAPELVAGRRKLDIRMGAGGCGGDDVPGNEGEGGDKEKSETARELRQ